MIDFLRKIHKPKYDPFNVITINESVLLNNYKILQSLQNGAEIWPVLKSNAYGHGLKELCKILNKSKAKMIALDSYPEAQIAYRYFKRKILILSELPQDAYTYTKLDRTEFVVYKQETLKYLAGFGKRVKVHLFFNSGMNREGVKDFDDFIANNEEYLKQVDLKGFCSHLAAADDLESVDLNKKQFNLFFEALNKLKAKGFNPEYVHLGNSAALLSLKDERLTAFRPGLIFYGYNPFFEAKKTPEGIKPALEVRSHLIQVQKIKKGETVSYNNKFLSESDSLIGLLPFGYFEGLDRRFSNLVNFEVVNKDNNFFAKIAGQVCMNLTCLNLGNEKVFPGSEVIIISEDNHKQNSLVNISKLSNTNIYENLVRLQGSLRRQIIKN